MPVSQKPRNHEGRMRARQNWIDAGRPHRTAADRERIDDIMRSYAKEAAAPTIAPKPQAKKGIMSRIGAMFGRRGS